MLAIVYDFLLILSIAVPPIILSYLLYLGLKISHEGDSEPAEVQRAPSKPSRRAAMRN